MKLRLQNRLIALVVFAVMAGLVWPRLNSWSVLNGLGSGWLKMVVVGAITALVAGTVAALVLYVVRRLRQPHVETPQETEVKELRLSLRKAEDQLPRSGGLFRPRLRRHPVLLVLGRSQSGKSQLVTASGIKPHLLFGDSSGNGDEVPTRTVNVWLADGRIIVEASERVQDTPDLWAALLKCLRPGYLAHITRRAPPRSLVLCVPVDRVWSGYQDIVSRFREQAARVSAAFDTRVPQYVVFTKTDAVNHFPSFVSALDRDQRRMALGVTLRPSDRTDLAGYEEEQSTLLQRELDRLRTRLSAWRLRVMRKEPNERTVGQAFEFPREFLSENKPLSYFVPQFLLELGIPPQTGVQPLVRGFFFVGRGSAPRAQDPPPRVGRHTTFIPRAAVQESGRRGREDLCFGARLFQEVLLRDPLPQQLATTGSAVTKRRRLGTVFALAAGVVLLFWVGRSYGAGMDLRESATDVLGTPAPRAPLSTASVLHVDTLVSFLEDSVEGGIIRRIVRRNPPGLNPRGPVRSALRREISARYGELIGAPLRDSLQGRLDRARSGQGEADYPSVYYLLSSYLAMADSCEFVDQDFQDAVGQLALEDQARIRLVDLAGRVYRDDRLVERTLPSSGVVNGARARLAEMDAVEALYLSLIRRANDEVGASPPLPYEGFVRLDPVTPAFSSAGRDFVDDQLRNPERLVPQTGCVLGAESAGQSTDVRALVGELRQRYEAEYVERWQRFLADARIEPAPSTDDAIRRLDQLVGDDGSLHTLVLYAAQRQRSADLVGAMRPLTAMIAVDDPEAASPAVSNGGQTELARAYFEAMRDVRDELSDFAEIRALDAIDGARDVMDDQLDAAARALRNLGDALGTDTSARRTVTALGELLNEPLRIARAAAAGVPSRLLNARVEAFCADYNALVRGRYPLDRTASLPLELGSITEVFGRERSLVQNLIEELEPFVEQTGDQFRRAQASRVEPGSDFLGFLSRARQFSAALYPEGRPGPSLDFSFGARLPPGGVSVTFAFAGNAHTCTPTSCTSRTFSWTAGGSPQASLSADFGGTSANVGPFTGPWALFRIFESARGWTPGANTHDLRWSVSGTNIDAQVALSTTAHVLSRDFLNGLQCPGRFTR